MPRRKRPWKVWIEVSGRSWRCRWRGIYGAGQEIFVRKKSAEAYADDKRDEFQRLNVGLPPLKKASAPTSHGFAIFRTDLKTWQSSRRSDRTIYITGRALDLWEGYAGPLFPVPPGPEVDGPTITGFSNHLLTQYQANAARIYLRHLKAAFRWGMKNGHLDYDPFRGFEFPAAIKVSRFVPPQEFAAIMAELPRKYERVLRFILHTGLRLGEVFQLDWSGIRAPKTPLENWYLTVQKTKTRRNQPETKTQAIHPDAVPLMGPPQASGRVFPFEKSWLGQRLRDAVKKLGLPRTRIHDLRHTWSTMLLEESRDLRGVMQVAGLKTVPTAMIYQHDTAQRRDTTLKFPSQTTPIRPLNEPKRGEDADEDL